MLVAAILVCEALFWVVLLAGLATRYLLRRPRLGSALLVTAPLVDLILLTLSVIDLSDGGTASAAHSLAAIYIGVSVGFGHSMIRWADERFAHRFAGGPAPQGKPRHGVAHAAYERKAWLRHVVAWAVGCALMGSAVLVIGDAGRTASLTETMRLWTVILGIDGVISLSYTFSPREAKADEKDRAPESSRR